MTTLDGLAGGLGRLGRVATLAARTVMPVDTNPVPAEWTHVTKVDPEDAKTLPLLYPLYLQHTDAVSVGGSADVTARNTEETFDLLAPASVPVFHEPSGPRHVTRRTRERADLLAIPEVLNGDSESLVGQLGEGTEYIREELVPGLLGDRLPWLPACASDALANFATSWLLAEAIFEAYIVQNPQSAAASESNVSEADLLTSREAKQRAMAAERHLGSELIYLEYSGTYGGGEAVETLREISDALSWSRLWYGGGVDSRERALAMLEAGADTIVVGDAFHCVAEAEADVCERATRELDPDADLTAVRGWLRENVAIADSAATSFLATIPSVSDPQRLAERYLAAAVRTWLGLRNLASDGTRAPATPSSVDLQQFLGPEVASALTDADAALVRRCLLGLADVGSGKAAADGELVSKFPSTHFELSLST